MKRLFIILICCLCLAACEEEAPIATPQPTRAPTVATHPPIVATEKLTVFDPADIPTFSVDSSCFSRVGYDAHHETLLVCFRDSGAYYCYYDFTQADYDDFIAADSLGSYYNKYIKGYYECDKLAD